VRLRLIASLAVAITLNAACSNANSSGGTASGRSGVDAHESRVVGLTAKLTAKPTAARDPWRTLMERMRW
jgi:hypothetical protein